MAAIPGSSFAWSGKHMDTITFCGVVLKHVEICRPKKGPVYIRVHFVAEVTEPVTEAMGWESVPECVEGAKLSGLLSGSKFVLSPADKALKDYEIQLSCLEVADFQIFRIEKKDESVRSELRFVVRTDQESAETYLANWMRKIGGGEGVLKVSYNATNPQANLPLDEKAVKA